MVRLTLLSLVFLFVSCNQGSISNINPDEINAAFSEHVDIIILENKGVKITEANDFPLFSDCSLKFIAPKSNAFFGPNQFELEVDNFNLIGSTVDEKQKGVRLNDKGQFLYVIKNRKKIDRFNTTKFDFDLPNGTTNYFMAPSRSYEMSIKNDNSYLAFEYNVEGDSCHYNDIKEPSIYLCSPSGIYPNSHSDKVLLDFFIINTEINDQTKVKITIDKDLHFIVDKWAPFYVEGLNPGNHTVKLQLVDKSGENIQGNYTSFEETRFTLQKFEAIK